jgi:hypothetical protein
MHKIDSRKVIRYFLLVLLLGPLAILIDSCLGNNCKCTTVDSFYKIEKTGLDVRSHAPSTSIYKMVNDSGKLNQQDFTLFMNFQYSYYSSIQQQAPSYSFIPAAMACDCVYPGYDGSPEKIKSIDITTMNDYNSSFSAGDTINSLVSINGRTLPEFITDWNKSKGAQNTFQVVLNPIPDAEVWQQLRISVQYGSSNYTANSVIFRLTP